MGVHLPSGDLWDREERLNRDSRQMLQSKNCMDRQGPNFRRKVEIRRGMRCEKFFQRHSKFFEMIRKLLQWEAEQYYQCYEKVRVSGEH